VNDAVFSHPTRSLTAMLLALIVWPYSSAHAQLENEFMHPEGFLVTLPAGWAAQPVGDGQYQLVPPDATADELVLVTTAPAGELVSATERHVIDETERQIVAMYPMLSKVGEPLIVETRLGSGVISTFEGRPLGGRRMQLATGLVMADGLAISILAVGPRREMLQRRADIEQIFASLLPGHHGGHNGYVAPVYDEVPYEGQGSQSFASGAVAAPGNMHDGSPAASEWAQFLRGKKVVAFSGYTSGGSSGGYSSTTELLLHADGRFDYYSASSVSIYIEGMSGGSASEDRESGIWRVISSGGAVMLEFTTETGRFQDELRRSGDDIYLGDQSVLVTSL
jgi:hypothetical protein